MEAQYYRFETSKVQSYTEHLLQEPNYEEQSGKPNVSNIRKQKNGFVLFDRPIEKEQKPNKDGTMPKPLTDKEALSELEEKLFGIHRPDQQEQKVADRDWVPIKTGIVGQKFLKYGPKHIFDATDHEPLYAPQDNILEDSLRKDAERVAYQENLINRIVYDSQDAEPNSTKTGDEVKDQPDAMNDFQEGRIPSIPTRTDCDNGEEFEPWFKLKGDDDTTLQFESRFETANLRRAIQVHEYDYDLILKPDYLTKGYTQWFYFRASNTRAGKNYRFSITNLVKPDSLYNHGMRPLMYSEIDAVRYNKGWTRTGKDICYYANSIKRKGAFHYYTLTFNITFQHDHDTVYFAHSYPYTYSDLIRYLAKLEADPRTNVHFQRKVLCQSLAGNPCDVLTITNWNDSPEKIKQKKGIVISARVHPGETGASYMMKGVLDYLVGPTIGAKFLRDNYLIKCVPMVNADGVINGNTRCSLAGVDLNRMWMDPQRDTHPVVFHLKMLIRQMNQERDVILFCDLHGHSRKKNIFMYGNSVKGDTKYKERIFPYILEQQAEVFSYSDCAFSVQRQKEGTGRVVGWKELGVSNSYTLEASFCGSDFGKYADLHFNTDMLQEMGFHFCEAIIEYVNVDEQTLAQIREEIDDLLNQNQNEKNQNQQQTENELLQSQLERGLQENSGALIGGGLGTIQDEHDSNQDSDFSGDEDKPDKQENVQNAENSDDDNLLDPDALIKKDESITQEIKEEKQEKTKKKKDDGGKKKKTKK